MTKKKLFNWLENDGRDFLAQLTVAFGPQDETIRRAVEETRKASPKQERERDSDSDSKPLVILTRSVRHLGSV